MGDNGMLQSVYKDHKGSSCPAAGGFFLHIPVHVKPQKVSLPGEAIEN